MNKSLCKDNHYYYSYNNRLGKLIWNIHHLTTSSNFSFVQAETPPLERPARISRNEVIIFGMLVLRGFLYCLTLASTLARSKPQWASLFGFSLSSVGIFRRIFLYLARYHKMTYILAKVFSRCLESKIWKIYWEGRRWDTPLDFGIVANRVLRPASYRRV